MAMFRNVFRRYWKAFLSVLFVPVLGNVFAGEFRDWVYTWFGWKESAAYLAWTASLTFVLLFVAAVVTIYWGRALFRPENVARGPRADPVPHPHVVLFLSNLSVDRGTFVDGVPAGLALTGDLAADIKEMERVKALDPKAGGVRWQWEMPLRGLHHHRSALASVTLVCSKESLAQAHWFAGLPLGRYAGAFPPADGGPRPVARPPRHGGGARRLPGGCAGDLCAGSWEFENYEELYAGLSGMIDRFAAEGVRDKDVTGGQKPNSIVGAILTVNRGRSSNTCKRTARTRWWRLTC